MCLHASLARKLALVVIVVSSALTLKESLPHAAQQLFESLVKLNPASTAAKRRYKFFAPYKNRKPEVDATNVAPALFNLVFEV
jgi:hypothetical protein